jgi:hypothetical protein
MTHDQPSPDRLVHRLLTNAGGCVLWCSRSATSRLPSGSNLERRGSSTGRHERRPLPTTGASAAPSRHGATGFTAEEGE